MAILTRITLGLFVGLCMWASLNVPVKDMWNHITPNVLRPFGPAPKALIVAATEPETDHVNTSE